MSFFIKTEKFTEATKNLTTSQRKEIIESHKKWVEDMNFHGIKISSGYLIDSKEKPGAGGLLILSANSYEEAKEIIQNDPMIFNNLVTWELYEWVPILGDPPQ